MIGVPAVRPVVADIRAGSVAEQANILPGMELNAVDGIETPDWNSVRMAMISKIGDDFTVLNVVPEPGSAPAENASISPAGNLIRKNRMLSCLWGSCRCPQRSVMRLMH